MKKILILIACLLIGFSIQAQITRPTVKAGAISIAGQDTTGEMLWYNHTTGKWETTYGAYLKWLQATRILNLGTAVKIQWGTDVNLYRSAANTLKTDDNLSVVGTIYTPDYIVAAGRFLLDSSNFYVADKTEAFWRSLMTRNTTGADVVYDLGFIGNITMPYASTIATSAGKLNLNPATFLGIKTATPYHTLSNYSATPVWALTNTTVNKNVTNAAQASDSAAILLDISGIPTIKFASTNGLGGNITATTADALSINAFTNVFISAAPIILDATKAIFFDGGGDTYIFESSADILDTYVGGVNLIKVTEGTGIDAVRILNAPLRVDSSVIVPIVSVTSTDTISGNYPIGSMFMRITAADTSMWVKIRMTGVLSARWKKLTP